MLEFTEKQYVKTIPRGKYILAGDIGGTNANFGILAGKKLKLFLSLHFKSKEIKDFTKVVDTVVTHVYKKYKITFASVCFAAAGADSGKGLCMTNRNFCIDLTKIKKKTKMASVFLINDFEAISYGINVLDKSQFLTIKEGVLVKKAPRIVVGAGTGLGKGFLIYEKDKNSYVAYPSEGGHGDAVVIGEDDWKLFSFIQKETRKDIIEWEDLISGQGIVNLYHFVGHLKQYKKTKWRKMIQNHEAPQMLISKFKHRDNQSRDAYTLFIKFYARCAKNFALDILPFSGVYIAGGIAAANPEPFNHKIFVDEFTNTKKQKDILKKIPIFLIKDYNVSLYGAAFMASQKRGEQKRGGK